MNVRLIRVLCSFGILLLACVAWSTAAQAARVREPVASVIIGSQPAMAAGTSATFSAVAQDASGHTVPRVTVKWASSNLKVAIINRSTGRLTALAPGTARITATAQGITGRFNLTVITPSTLGGTSAMGTALGGAPVTLVDANGATRTTTTDSNGNYSFTTNRLTAPFLIAVQVSPGVFLYSVSADTNSNSTVNVTPLTDLIIRSWYSAQGVDVATAFASPVTNPAPSPAQVQLISTVVVDVTALWLQQNGVDTSNFSPISTTFTANNTGEDAVLDDTSIDTNTGAITISDGTTTQNSTVTYDTSANSMSVSSTTTGPNGTSSSVTGTVVAAGNDAQVALAGIATGLNEFAGVVTTKGSELAASDVVPLLDPNLLQDGFNATDFADNLVTQLRGSSISFTIQSLNSLDTVNGIADATVIVTETLGNQSAHETLDFFFKQIDGNWLFSGDQRLANLKVHQRTEVQNGGAASTDFNIFVEAPQGSLSNVDASGGPFDAPTVMSPGNLEIDTWQPSPGGSKIDFDLDTFGFDANPVGALQPAGTVISFAVTPTSGPVGNYDVTIGAFTSEAISLPSPNGGSLSDLNLGGPVGVTWTLPTTFAVAHIQLSALTTNADGNVTCDAVEQGLGAGVTNATITIAATCNGKPVTQVEINLAITGVNGEDTEAQNQFN